MIRISTLNLYDQGINGIENAQSTLAQTQETIATGLSVNVASDNPVAASQIVSTVVGEAQNTQLSTNLGSANNSLTLTDNTLTQVNDLLTNVRTELVQANNGTLDATDRGAIAAQLQSQLSELVGLANTQDGNGNYLFAGSNATQPAFTQTATGVTYNGNDVARQIQVTPSQTVASTVTGLNVFQKVATGNGVFTTGNSAANTGTGIIDTGSVTDPAALTGDSYQISFAVAGGQTTYSVTDTTSGTTLSTGNAYTAGNAITFDGITTTVNGAPANGDTFSVTPSTNQSVFASIQQAITALQSSASGSGSNGPVGSLQTSILNINNALTNVNGVQATVGASQNLLTTLQSANTSQGLTYQTNLSNLQDTDMAKASSNLAEQQTVLSAAEDSFSKITTESLFNYLPT